MIYALGIAFLMLWIPVYCRVHRRRKVHSHMDYMLNGRRA